MKVIGRWFQLGLLSYSNEKSLYFAGLAQLVEQLPCKQQAGGSSPLTSSIDATIKVVILGELLKWPTRADCKSAGFYLPWFESTTHHHRLMLRG